MHHRQAVPAATDHDHNHEDDNVEIRFDQDFWDERYRSRSSLWSGNPNANLVAQASGLAPGRAIDVGCGEGADAIWLAERGWRVMGCDVSAVALERAAAQAARLDGDVSARIEWVREDVLAWQDTDPRFDLASAQYMHLPSGRMRLFVEHLASAVVAGGSLLVVGHHPSDLEAVPHSYSPDLFFTGDDLASYLDQAEWKVVTNEASARPAQDPDGRPLTLHDTVFRAERRQPSPD
jgi:SAM-dependent methyltransferase